MRTWKLIGLVSIAGLLAGFAGSQASDIIMAKRFMVAHTPEKTSAVLMSESDGAGRLVIYDAQGDETFSIKNGVIANAFLDSLSSRISAVEQRVHGAETIDTAIEVLRARVDRLEIKDPPPVKIAPPPAGEKRPLGISADVQLGNVGVRCAAIIGKAPLVDAIGEPKLSNGNVLIVTLGLMNITATEKISYRTWRGSEHGNEWPKATLVDNFGNQYAHIDFGYGTKLDGAVSEWISLHPGNPEIDRLVYELPLGNISELTLVLPGENVGASGQATITIPKADIQRE